MAKSRPLKPATRARRKKKFLEALEENGGFVTQAAEAAQVARSVVYDWRNEDEEFARDWEAAQDRGLIVLEEEAYRRGVRGVKKPVFQQGKRVGHVQEYSDALLIFMLKARAPERYRDNVAVNVSGNVNNRHTHEMKFDYSKLSQSELRQLSNLQAKALPPEERAKLRLPMEDPLEHEAERVESNPEETKS